MKITIYRGAEEIGGNCIEVASEKTRLILDVGIPLVERSGEAFDESRLIGKTSADLLGEGILPPVPGLWRGVDENQAAPDAVLVSHSHADHTGFLNRIRPEIPVFMTGATYLMMHVGNLFSGGVDLPQERRNLMEGKPKSIGDCRVTAFPVDHSVFGSNAFLIEAEGKSVLYSGDFRLHGRKQGMAKRLCETLQNKPLDAILMEGTLLESGEIGPREATKTEAELEDEIVQRLQEEKGLVLAVFSPQHVDRLVGFYKASQRTGRTLILDVYAAYVMHKVAEFGVKIPYPTEANGIRVFYPRRFRKKDSSLDPGKIYRLFLEDRIELSEILERRSNYVMLFRDSMFDFEFDRNLPPETSCFYSLWQGYLEKEQEEKQEESRWREIIRQISEKGGHFYPDAHTSGHASPDDLIDFANRLDAKLTIPVHTLHPEALPCRIKNARALMNGKTLII